MIKEQLMKEKVVERWKDFWHVEIEAVNKAGKRSKPQVLFSQDECYTICQMLTVSRQPAEKQFKRIIRMLRKVVIPEVKNFTYFDFGNVQ